MTSKPMCERWYERAGSYRPWHRDVPGCTCGVTAHHLPGQHDMTCPVRQAYVRREQPAIFIPGEPER